MPLTGMNPVLKGLARSFFWPLTQHWPASSEIHFSIPSFTKPFAERFSDDSLTKSFSSLIPITSLSLPCFMQKGTRSNGQIEHNIRTGGRSVRLAPPENRIVRIGGRMMKIWAVMLLLYLQATSCVCVAGDATGSVHRITVVVTSEVIHVGHSINRSRHGGITHDFWYDGCWAQITSSRTQEPLLVWWSNNEIKGTPYTFSNGLPYQIEYHGTLNDGPLDQTGRCLRVTQILSSKQMRK